MTMAQKEIIEMLEKVGEAMSLSELIERLDGQMNSSAVTRAISQLTKYGEVQSVEIDVRIARRIYGKKVKNKIKVYFVE